MPKTEKLLFSFNAGELTPLLGTRIDQSKYQAGCRIMENFIPLIHGGATRRPGTEYITGCKSNSAKSMLVAFQHSVSDRYILEFANQAIRVYKDGAQLQSAGSAYEITTPYLTADLFQLKFEHSADVMYITHPTYEPRRLARTADTTWTLTVVSRNNGPFIDENTDEDITITPSAVTGSITLTAASSTFDDDHAPPGSAATDTSTTGAYFQISHVLAARGITSAFAANGDSSTLTVYKGDVLDFVTQGLWSGTVTLKRSYDGTNYLDVWPTTSDNNANDKVPIKEDVADATYKMTMSSYSSGTCDARLTARARIYNGVVKITAVASATSATATVLKTLGSTDATYRWSEGAWSERLGWPSCVAISNEDRLVFAGTTGQPLTVWGSKIGDYDEFERGSNDDDAIVFTLAGTGQQNIIRWILPKSKLILGTAGGEHTLGASSQDEALTPSNVQARVQSTYGSENIQALMINDSVLFVQRGARKLREMLYDFAYDTFRANDLSVFSEHITDSGIVQMAFQKSPDPLLWMVRDDGVIVIMSYDRAQQVNSWAKVITEDSSD